MNAICNVESLTRDSPALGSFQISQATSGVHSTPTIMLTRFKNPGCDG